MMHPVFVNVTQASEVRTLVAQQRIPILKPNLPSGSVIEFIHRAGCDRMQTPDQSGQRLW